jgi:hypothetical protein
MLLMASLLCKSPAASVLVFPGVPTVSVVLWLLSFLVLLAFLFFVTGYHATPLAVAFCFRYCCCLHASCCWPPWYFSSIPGVVGVPVVLSVLLLLAPLVLLVFLLLLAFLLLLPSFLLSLLILAAFF